MVDTPNNAYMLLTQLADAHRQLAIEQTRQFELKDNLLTDEQHQQMIDIDIEYAAITAALRDQIAQLDLQVREAVLRLHKTVTIDGVTASYGVRESVPVALLRILAAKHPDVAGAMRTTEVVSITFSK